MNRKFKWLTAASCAIAALSVFTSCQDDDMSQQSTDLATNVHTYRIVADVDAAPNGKGTRALTEDASSVIHSAWLQNDKMIAYCLNDQDQSKEKQYNLLQSANAGQGSKFDGTFKSVKAITASDEICFFYPGAASVGEEATITSTMRMKGDGKEEPLVYYEQQPTIKQTVALNLTEQDGTAETIGKKFDYQWAKAKPSAVNGTDVKVKSVNMQRLIAIWGLRFASKDDGILTDIDQVYITGIKSSDVFDLGTGQFITDNPNDESDNIVLKPANNGKFTSANGKYTYAAILPGTYAKVLITVYVGDKCYAREYENVKLEADKVYRSDVINMDQVNAQPYVEVQGVNWATGNFIHYGVEGSGNDYWGIAPTQWWISQYDMVDPDLNIRTTSQFTKNDIEADPNDLDMFRFGDIDKATTLKHNNSKAEAVDICKKFWKRGGPLGGQQIEMTQTEMENSPNLAAWGDIVWFHTKKDKQKYRMPTKADYEQLYKYANAIPAYCIAPTGKRIYGAFFWTNPGGSTTTRTMKFPTGHKKALHRFNDVTALVRANKGLFLPITGRRRDNASKIGFRNLADDRKAYSQYMSSEATASFLSQDFFFGTNELNLAPNGVTQGKSIRPVWDETSSKTEFNPVYPAFKDLH